MGKYMSIVVGGGFALVGLIALIAWRFDFIILLRGCVPAMMIFGGLIAVIAGISEIKDEAASKKEETKK